MAGLVTTFGSGAMTNSIDDINDARCILAIGTNTTVAHPIIGMNIRQAIHKGTKLIVANPLEIDLVRDADLWLRHRSGTDVALLTGMMKVIIDEGLMDSSFIEQRCENFDDFKDSLRNFPIGLVEHVTGVPGEKITEAARMYATNSPATLLYAMGITQHTHGTDNVIATANLAMLTGNIGKPGAGVNPLRGQNNVQGACDMGALPNVYPGYQAVNNEILREKFEGAWDCQLNPNPGKTLTEIIPAAHEGKIKAIYLMGENPYLSDPDASHVREFSGEDLDIEVLSGGLNFSVNALTMVNLNVPRPIYPRPSEIHVTEGELVEIELVAINLPEDWFLLFLNPEEIVRLGEWNFEDGGQLGLFTWQTNRDAGRDNPYVLRFAAADPDSEVVDFEDVLVYVTEDINAIQINAELREQIFDWDGENDVWIFILDEDAGWTEVIQNLYDFFIHPQEQQMQFAILNDVEGLNQGINEDDNSYRIMVEEEHWNGRMNDLGLGASDEEERDHVFNFDLVVLPVNDMPVIIDEEGIPYEDEISFSITERDAFSLDLRAEDIEDDPERLVWSVLDADDLPEGWEFTDNHDGTAEFTWTPNLDAAREDPYSPVFQVMDSERGVDTLKVNITVDELSIEDMDVLPSTFEVNAIYPNPFNSMTTIAFALPNKSNVNITAWDLHGRMVDQVFSGHESTGYHTVTWKPLAITSGIYILKINLGDKQFLGKVLFVK